ncbi:putative het domain-containing protein [Botrytis fragariae]|uniref:Putative het domain-containing protein n=1 Tax=Botrytis fragariae TaxID=1964551 RepID=A0A8H6AMS6_9HELO|nr:putative het domain-containing protein [Botrytis fragariae]KAF5870427.1 putative het domain-containing protein [Botrytis fragariae]
MAHIYSSSFLNIAATACKGSTVGLFCDGWNEEDGFLGTPREIRGAGKGPMMSRAWVYQERFLAPWTYHGIITIATERKKDLWFGQWGIIDEYSKLNLSKPADRLPAIAGIASHFESHKRRIKNGKSTTSRYFAGLWEDNLHHDLLWRVTFPENKPREVVRIVPYNALTWPWASLDSKFIPSGKPGQSVNIGIHYSTGGIAPDFKILDCFTTLIDPSNIYGGVKSGKIVLQGSRAIKDNQSLGKLIADNPLALSRIIKDRVDYGELHCLWINSFQGVRRNDYRHLALVLKQSETPEVYERVGIATLDKGGIAVGGGISDSTFRKFMESIWTRSSIQTFEVV